jgi:hypothetical protein
MRSSRQLLGLGKGETLQALTKSADPDQRCCQASLRSTDLALVTIADTLAVETKVFNMQGSVLMLRDDTCCC